MIFHAFDRVSRLIELFLEPLNRICMIAHLEIHILHLSVKCFYLSFCSFLMLNLFCFNFRHLIMHDMEDVLVPSLIVEYCVVQLFCVYQAFFQPFGLFFQLGFRVISDWCHRFDYGVADHLNSRLNIIPVELVHFISRKSFSQLIHTSVFLRERSRLTLYIAISSSLLSTVLVLFFIFDKFVTFLCLGLSWWQVTPYAGESSFFRKIFERYCVLDFSFLILDLTCS